MKIVRWNLVWLAVELPGGPRLVQTLHTGRRHLGMLSMLLAGVHCITRRAAGGRVHPAEVPRLYAREVLLSQSFPDAAPGRGLAGKTRAHQGVFNVPTL